ncbi:unnamed protein product [Nippostrongylus brasiliensis]|uniref:Transposase_23 domain-containing protein n=1 Tax=Nippostrongylus brasiliensis TaxID=27835 RepID=A0A0N4XVQ8_NIPBR|nr:unnamed protein product [Nippostrongylus brasiliensis]
MTVKSGESQVSSVFTISEGYDTLPIIRRGAKPDRMVSFAVVCGEGRPIPKEVEEKDPPDCHRRTDQNELTIPQSHGYEVVWKKVSCRSGMSVLTDISEGERTGKGSRSESNISCASNIDSEVAKASTVTDNGEVHFGDRLLDDLMNTFCDRLQAACPRKIDGCLAIQFVMVDPQSLKTLLNVGRPAQQIIFDPDRVHYVVVDYDPQVKTVVLYDSLVEKDASATNLVRMRHASFHSTETSQSSLPKGESSRHKV